MSATEAILEAAGIDPDGFALVAYAPVIEYDAPIEDKPALVAGKYHGSNAAIRAWPRVRDAGGLVLRWDALAFVSQHPALALDQLTVEERERLRAESQVAQGADKPVGQEAVLDQPPPAPAPVVLASVPYAPPLPDAAEDLPGDEGVRVEPAACGTEGCMTAISPTEGTQTIHVEGCPEFEGA